MPGMDTVTETIEPQHTAVTVGERWSYVVVPAPARQYDAADVALAIEADEPHVVEGRK